jgi:hypothetical protein
MTSRLVFGFTTWWTDDEPAFILLWLDLKALHIALCHHSLCGPRGWGLLVVFYGYRILTLLLSGLRLKKVPFVLLTAKLFIVSQESHTQLAFHNVSRRGSYYWVKRHIREDLIFQNYCQTVYSMFLMTFFSENDDFVREKLCRENKITVKLKQAQGKWQYFKCGGNHMGKRRQNAKFRTFYWKSSGETNSIWPNKCDQ